MIDRDPAIATALDRLVPQPRGGGDWSAVVHDARVRRRGRLTAALVPVAAVVAVAAGALLWPFSGSQQRGPLDRALAAVGDGPVLHIVLRGEWGGTLIDLKTKERRPLYGEREQWYDPDHGLRQILRFGGVVQEDTFLPTGDLGPPQAKILKVLSDYRDALASGRARDLGPGEAYGEPVHWLRVHSELLPDSADGKDHEWALDVGVSPDTFKPVATRETRDGVQGPGSAERILELDLVDRDQVALTPTGPAGLDGTAFSEGREAIALDNARDALGTSPLWLGRERAGLPLAQVTRTTLKTGRSEQRLMMGPDAAAAKACLAAREASDERPEACLDLVRKLGHGFSLRGKNVYIHGPVEWGPERTGLVLFYGRLQDDPSTYKRDSVPSIDSPHVTITEGTDRMTARARPSYDVPAGSVLVMPGHSGALQRDGLYVSIEASSDELLVSAARALETMPR